MNINSDRNLASNQIQARSTLIRAASLLIRSASNPMSHKKRSRRRSHSFDEFDDVDDSQDEIDIETYGSSPPQKRRRVEQLIRSIAVENDLLKRVELTNRLQSLLTNDEIDANYEFETNGRNRSRSKSKSNNNDNNCNNNNNNNINDEFDRYNYESNKENELLNGNSSSRSKSSKKNGLISKTKTQKRKEVKTNESKEKQSKEEELKENESKKAKKESKPIVRLWLFVPSLVRIAISFRGNFTETYVKAAELTKERIWLYWGQTKGTRNVSNTLSLEKFFKYVEEKRIDALRDAKFVLAKKENDKEEIEGMFVFGRKKYRILLVLLLFVVFVFY